MKPLNKIAYAVALATVSSGSWADNTQPDTGAAPDWQQTQLAANHTQAKGAGSRVETLLVTGTRGSVERTVESSPAPVDVLTEDIVRKANQANLLSALNTALPSFNVPGLPGYGVNSTVKAGQLRGLNSSHVLVLVNGKRRHASSRLGAGGFAASAPVDLGLIPTGSIERIEVLRDGASAIYGSDAIAGVINIITKKDASGGSVSGRFGQHYEGDGEVQQYIARSGFELGEGGHVYVSAQLDDQQPAFRDSPVPDDVLFYFPLDANGNAVLPIGNRSTGPKLPAGATPDPREASVDRDNIVFGASGGVPEARLASFTADAALPLGAASELYGFASYAERDARSPQHFRFPSRDQVVRALWPDGFTPYSGIKETDYSLQLGAKGSDWLGWGWDISSVYGNNDIDHYQYDSNSPSYGLESKTDFYIGNYQYGAWTNNIDLRRSLESGLFGLLTDVSLGAEYRRETYKRGAGEEQSWNHGGQPILDGPNAGNPISISDAGSQADIGVRPEDVADDSRNSYAAYGGISLYPRSNWVVDLAARYEDYSDFGDITTGRLSSRYDINDNLALRGTVSSGFQAPALAAQTVSQHQPHGGVHNPYALGRFTRSPGAGGKIAAARGVAQLHPGHSGIAYAQHQVGDRCLSNLCRQSHFAVEHLSRGDTSRLWRLGASSLAPLWRRRCNLLFN